MFSNTGLKTLPKVIGAYPSNAAGLFYNSRYLREIPMDFFDTWNFNYWITSTGGYNGNISGPVRYCWSLRSLPMTFFKNHNPYSYINYCYFNSGFESCIALDELVNLPITYIAATWTSNVFSSTFYECHRLKEITFETNEDGTPIVIQWKSQNIDLTNYVGYVSASNKKNILNYNSGITADKEVTDDATYQALKDDPDWFTTNIAYSRYNHDSAVATINSLPDTSAYLTANGGTNTIKFKGKAGSATDGGAINTLTEEEIAVAAAKGWTVSFV